MPPAVLRRSFLLSFSMIIGIPRILWFYENWFSWDLFFTELGIRVKISQETDRKILNDGLKFAEEEFCLPVKAALGHVISLKGSVDCLFLPHVVSRVKNSYCCPKFIGIADVVRNSLPDRLPIIEPVIDVNKQRFGSVLVKLGARFTRNPYKIYKAIQKAKERAVKTRMLRLSIEQPLQKQLKLALIAHPYLSKDDFINMRIRQKLMGAQASLSDVNDLPEEILLCRPEDMHSLNWDFIKRLHAGLLHFLQNDIDGIIYIACFGCGPDSLAGEIFRRETEACGRPFLQLTIDENTQEAGFDTRLEAFIDMIKRKKK